MSKERWTGEQGMPWRPPVKLDLWQERLAESDRYWDDERAKMDRREQLLKGDRLLTPLVPGDTNKDGTRKRSSHIRNIAFELIETQVTASIPQPKVTPRRREDEALANIIEHFLRNELDRQNFEEMNDMAERTVPTQGGVGWQVEWDNTKRTHLTIGEADVSTVHPKQFAPQPGIYTGIEDMDWFIIKVPTTKEAVRRKYGVPVYNESESEPDVRSDGAEDYAEDAVTMYVGYEKGEKGINKFVWVNDVKLEDLEDYQARRQPVCKKCGRVKPMPGQLIQNQRPAVAEDPERVMEREIAGQMIAQRLAARTTDPATGNVDHLAGIEIQGDKKELKKYDGGPCPWCGGEEFTDKQQEFEEVVMPVQTIKGIEIPGAKAGFDEFGEPVLEPTLIPFYKPDLYPIILQRSVSVYGQLLGTSDIDMIEDQQNTINRLEQKIIDRLMKAGTRITLPEIGTLRIDPEDGEKWYIPNAQAKSMIGIYDFSGNLEYELTYLSQVYEEARQILGITDSFQGRKDATATSAVAKEFAASQSAGRLESKRVMKKAAYAKLFELMFKNWLAYSDEPRPVSYKDHEGHRRYETFNRYDFLEKDANGEWFWNDMFLFSCDDSAPLASNREAMWQETRMNLQTGAFGDPGSTETLILFWTKMEELHYPGAGQTKSFLEARLRREQEQAQQMAMLRATQNQTMLPAMGG